jgi:DNA polymerase
VECVLILLIVTQDPAGSDLGPTLREWLRSDARLGISHVGVPLRSAPPAMPSPQGGSTARDLRPPQPVAPASAPRATSTPPRTPTVPATPNAVQPLLLAREPAGLPPLCDRELPPAEAIEQLTQLDTQFVKGCKQCGLCAARTQTVFGTGNPRPRLAFVGEGPGADEDRVGKPFVGRAGELLTKMIAAMTLSRDEVYICNIVKCRPPGNRTPTDEEMAACSPYLFRQLAILRPQVIVTLGRPATQTLLMSKAPIGQLRGQFHNFPPAELAHLGLPTVRLMPTFHPAYLLRSPGEKAKVWEDLKLVMRLLGIPIPRSGRSD